MKGEGRKKRMRWVKLLLEFMGRGKEEGRG